jgi:DNA polymerase-1
MYGQTSGVAGQALRGLERTYPTAMGYLRAADDSGRAGVDVRTHGGRLVRMGATPDDLEPAAERSLAAARGRYARNAVVQGAAAELFKAWAATVRARVSVHGARIVLCLHDELLVHAPEGEGAAVAALVASCLDEAAARWSPGGAVRFVADVSVVRRWSDAKG